MGCEKFSISECLLENGAPKELVNAVMNATFNPYGLLCVEHERVTLTMKEVLQLSQNNKFWFIQSAKDGEGHGFWDSLSKVDTSRPFALVEQRNLPNECPRQPNKHVIYICLV